MLTAFELLIRSKYLLRKKITCVVKRFCWIHIFIYFKAPCIQDLKTCGVQRINPYPTVAVTYPNQPPP